MDHVTLFQNRSHFNILLLVFKLSLLTSFLSSKIKRIFYLERVKNINERIVKWKPFWDKQRIRCIQSSKSGFPSLLLFFIIIMNSKQLLGR